LLLPNYFIQSFHEKSRKTPLIPLMPAYGRNFKLSIDKKEASSKKWENASF
jgi:hypothetical protein